jgi:hypothetical protein
MNARTSFVNALMASRVATRFAENQGKLSQRIVARFMSKQGTEFDSPEALQKYLKEHPDADKSKHTVKKPEKEEKAKDEDKPEKKEPEKEEGGGKGWKPKSMTFGEMPSKEDFKKHIMEGHDEDDEPLWPEGKGYSMRLRGEDEEVAQLCDLETDGSLKSPEEVYDYVEKLKDFADHDDEWYEETHQIDDPDEIEKLRDAAMSLSSSIMGTLGYEWI